MDVHRIALEMRTAEDDGPAPRTPASLAKPGSEPSTTVDDRAAGLELAMDRCVVGPDRGALRASSLRYGIHNVTIQAEEKREQVCPRRPRTGLILSSAR